MMQNSGLGNAVSPLTSLTWTFRLPQLLIVTWRGQPGVADEPQHALMGPITPQLLELMQIPWELFPVRREEIAPALERATRHMDSSRPTLCAAHAKGHGGRLRSEGGSADRSRGHPVARRLLTHRPATAVAGLAASRRSRRCSPAPADAATVVLASTGFCGRELFALRGPAEPFLHGGLDGMRVRDCAGSCTQSP